MPGCHICQDSDTRDGLCLEGLRLITALGYARAVAKFSTAPAHARTHIHAAKAAWLEHKNGSWDDEPEPLTVGELARLAAVRDRNAALISERAER